MGRQRTVNPSFPRYFRRVRNTYFYDHGMRPDGTRHYTSLGNDLALAMKSWRRLYKIDPREARPHYLYRHFDSADRLLYVGIERAEIVQEAPG